jgi:hypothetical protein
LGRNVVLLSRASWVAYREVAIAVNDDARRRTYLQIRESEDDLVALNELDTADAALRNT